MQEDKKITQKEAPAMLSVIQDLKDGRVRPEILSKELRQQCVEVFIGEGYSIPQMAQILGKSDRTISRDFAEIRQRNAIAPDIERAKRLVGELVTYAGIHRSHLMRLARIQSASVSERCQAEYLAFKVTTELISKLQTLGYLPQKPQEIVADFSHHISSDDDNISLDSLRDEISEIERISQEQDGMDKNLAEQISILRQSIEKAEIKEQITKIKDNQEKGEESHE